MRQKPPVKGICHDGGPLKVDLQRKATLTALSSALVCGRSIPHGSFSVREHNLSASPSSPHIFTRSSRARHNAAAISPLQAASLIIALSVILMLTCAGESASAAAVETSSQKSTPDVFLSLIELQRDESRVCGLGGGLGGRYHAVAPGPQTDIVGQRRLSSCFLFVRIFLTFKGRADAPVILSFFCYPPSEILSPILTPEEFFLRVSLGHMALRGRDVRLIEQPKVPFLFVFFVRLET